MVFEYPADYLIYPYYLYYIGGSFSVMFVVVFAHAIEVTPISMRQGGIILMEMSLYMAEKGFEIEKFLIGSFFVGRYINKTHCSFTFYPLDL